MSTYIEEKVKEVMGSESMKFLTTLHSSVIMTRGYPQWEGETTEDVVRKALTDLLAKVREELDSTMRYKGEEGRWYFDAGVTMKVLDEIQGTEEPYLKTL